MARTAVVAGTANAVVSNQNRRQAAGAQAAAEQQAAQQAAFEAQAQVAEMQAQLAATQAAAAAPPPPPPAAAPAAAPADDLMGQLTKLADMRAAGLLDDAEFAAAKAQLLGT